MHLKKGGEICKLFSITFKQVNLEKKNNLHRVLIFSLHFLQYLIKKEFILFGLLFL
jgi:hypothetical protein